MFANAHFIVFVSSVHGVRVSMPRHKRCFVNKCSCTAEIWLCTSLNAVGGVLHWNPKFSRHSVESWAWCNRVWTVCFGQTNGVAPWVGRGVRNDQPCCVAMENATDITVH